MTFSATLRTVSATAILLCAVPATAQAVCESARQCADITARHAPDGFDYDVLASEVSRLGPTASAAILALADDPDTVANAFALAARPEAPRALKAALMARWPEPSPALFLPLADSFQDASVRDAALRTLAQTSAQPTSVMAALRDASTALLATQDQPMTPAQAARAAPTLMRVAATTPDPVLLELLSQIPGERAAPIFVRALSSGDADAVVSAFAALSKINPDRAQGDLRAAFTKSPREHAGAWTQALERAGMTVPTFDAVAFGYDALRNRALAPHQRAVGLHTAMLYPAGAKGRVGGPVDDLLPSLATLPVSDRLAQTAATHPAMQSPRALQTLLGVWQGRDSEQAAVFARSLGRAQPPAARPLLRGLFARTGDYRVQIAVVEALAQYGSEDADWIAGATRTHPLRAVVEAGAKASGRAAPKPLPGCRPAATPLARAPERMPYFESGRYADGTPAPRWELNDAQPIPGGWLGGYEGGLVRYSSEDTAGATAITGNVVAVLPDTPPAPGKRASVFWVLTRGQSVAHLTRYDINAPIPAPSTLPHDVRVVELGRAARERFGGRGWGLAFEGDEQATLVVTREGRITPVCAAPKAGPFTPPRL